jgi:hypothetical protein
MALVPITLSGKPEELKYLAAGLLGGRISLKKDTIVLT